MKNLLIAAIVAFFAFAANAMDMKSKDGSMTFTVDAEQKVWWSKDGSAPAVAADGEYELSDGTKLMVKEGKKA